MEKKHTLLKIVLFGMVELAFIIVSFKISSQFNAYDFPYPLQIKNGLTYMSISTSLALFLVLLNILFRNNRFNPIQILYFVVIIFLHVLLTFFYMPYFITDHFSLFTIFLSFGVIVNVVIYGLFFILILYLTSFNKIELNLLLSDLGKVLINIPIGIALMILFLYLIDAYLLLGEPFNLLYPSFSAGGGVSTVFSAGLISAFLLLRINNIILEPTSDPENNIMTLKYSFTNLDKESRNKLISEFFIGLLCLLGGFALIDIVISDGFIHEGYSVPREYIFFVFLSAVPSAMFFSSNLQKRNKNDEVNLTNKGRY